MFEKILNNTFVYIFNLQLLNENLFTQMTDLTKKNDTILYYEFHLFELQIYSIYYLRNY